MENKKYDPQFESLKAFWDAQQERLSLLSGMTITDHVMNLSAAFGETEIMMFEKLMQTQKQLAEMASQVPVAPAVVSSSRRIPNPVIDGLDLSNPKTVRRFEIHPYENNAVVRGESMIPSTGILLLLGKSDAYAKAFVDFFGAKGLTVKQVETNLSEEEVEALIAKTAKEGPIVGLAAVANARGENMDEVAYDHTMTAVYLIKHYTIYIRALKPAWRSFMMFATFLDGKLGFTGESDDYRYGTFNGIAKTLSIEFGEYADVKLIDFEPTVSPVRMLEIAEDELCIRDIWPEIGRTNDGNRWSAHGIFKESIPMEGFCPYGADDVLLVTVDSRGVTSRCVLALMEKAPCKLVILGRAEIREEHMDDEESAKIPDLKEMKTLIARRFKAAGYKGSFSEIEKKAKDILAQREMLVARCVLNGGGSGCKADCAEAG